MQQKNYRTLGSILLVAGTCIGAGMIGVPVKTAAAGFFPTIIAFFIIWAFMVLSALLFLELSLAFRGEVNFISMIKEILGTANKNIAWFIYLLFMYSIMAAYTSGGVTLINQIIPMNFYLAIPIFLLPFAYIIYLGSKYIDLVNRFLTIGLIVSFILLCVIAIFLGGNHMQGFSNFVFVGNIKIILYALPIISTTFCYHVIIPSLKSYLKEELKPLKQAILIGTTIPLVVYLTWQMVILLLIPVFGDDGLVSMLYAKKNPADSIINYLMIYSQNKGILISIVVFLFCALTTSLIGIAWALFDFLADGFKIVKNPNGKIFLTSITFIPPIIYSVFFPAGFLKAVGFAAILSAALTIVYPALMVWKLRRKKFIYHPNLTDNIKYKAPIGNKLIMGILCFGVLIMVLECINIIQN